jgi:hypothetical protein
MTSSELALASLALENLRPSGLAIQLGEYISKGMMTLEQASNILDRSLQHPENIEEPETDPINPHQNL